jgi:hypothetical protein
VLAIHPEWASSRIAKHAGVTDKTVTALRKDVAPPSEIPNLREGQDGKKYPASKATPSAASEEATPAGSEDLHDAPPESENSRLPDDNYVTIER